MKSIIIALTVSNVSKKAVIRTNKDNASSRFTIMQVERPDGVSSDEFPFRYGDVYNIQDLLDKLSLLVAQGKLTITNIYEEDANSKKSLSSIMPVIKKVTISVTNDGAILKINGVVQNKSSWIGYLYKGDSVTYSAELDGYTTDTDTLTVSTSDITKSITLVEA